MNKNEDNENNEVIGEVKQKKPRTEAQIMATKRMLEKRKELDEIKRQHTEAVKAEKQLKLQEKKQDTIRIQKKLSEYQSQEEEEEEEYIERRPPVRSRSVKPRQRPRRTKIIYEEESESESEEEIVIVKPKKKTKAPKKKIVYKEESEEEEEQPKSLPQHINRTSQEQLKYDLQTERITSALRSLGYIA